MSGRVDLYRGPSVPTRPAKRALFVLFAAVALRMVFVAPSPAAALGCGFATVLLAAAARYLPGRAVTVSVDGDHLVVDDPWMWSEPVRVPVAQVTGFAQAVSDRTFPQVVPAPTSGLMSLLAPKGLDRCELLICFDAPVPTPRVGFFRELVAAVLPVLTGRMPSTVTATPDGQVTVTNGIRIPDTSEAVRSLEAVGICRQAPPAPEVTTRVGMLDGWLHTFTFTAAGFVAAMSATGLTFTGRAGVVAGCLIVGTVVSAVSRRVNRLF